MFSLMKLLKELDSEGDAVTPQQNGAADDRRQSLSRATDQGPIQRQLARPYPEEGIGIEPLEVLRPYNISDAPGEDRSNLETNLPALPPEAPNTQVRKSWRTFGVSIDGIFNKKGRDDEFSIA